MKRVLLTLAALTIVGAAMCARIEVQTSASDSLSRAESLLRQSRPLVLGKLAVQGPLKKVEATLWGSTWIVQSSDGQGDRWQFGEGTLNYQNLKIAADRGAGSWSLAGEKVTIKSGAATWEGTLNGSRMQGSAANASQTIKWTWTAERQ